MTVTGHLAATVASSFRKRKHFHLSDLRFYKRPRGHWPHTHGRLANEISGVDNNTQSPSSFFTLATFAQTSIRLRPLPNDGRRRSPCQVGRSPCEPLSGPMGHFPRVFPVGPNLGQRGNTLGRSGTGSPAFWCHLKRPTSDLWPLPRRSPCTVSKSVRLPEPLLSLSAAASDKSGIAP